MATSASSKPFRFRDLPSEIRNKIHRILLCDFVPVPTPVFYNGDMLKLPRVKHDIETSILRTSKETYREAYDVMIKNNRFVKVTSVKDIVIRGALCGKQASVVTEDKALVDQFKGYVLSIQLGSKGRSSSTVISENLGWHKPLAAMILHRDLDKVCLAIKDGHVYGPGFNEALKISIRMAPVLDNVRGSKITPSFEGFFSPDMQEILFAPLRTHLRGYKGVEVKGHVDSSVAVTLRKELAKDEFTDPEAVLAQFAAKKEEGSRLFRERQPDSAWQAWRIWRDTALEMDALLGTSSWPNLVLRGKEKFVSQMAKLYFLLRLNIIQIQLSRWSEDPSTSELLAEDSLDCAGRSLEPDYWMKGYTLTVSDQHMAKFYFRYATYLRLEGQSEHKARALHFINQALQKQPGDAALLKEKDRIVQWIRQS